MNDSEWVLERLLNLTELKVMDSIGRLKRDGGSEEVVGRLKEALASMERFRKCRKCIQKGEQKCQLVWME